VKHELCGIEALRFLCAFTVIIHHYHLFFLTGAWHAVDQSTFPLYAILFPAYDAGRWAVQFFWAISGFIFYWRYGQSIQKTGASKFSNLRFSRLYPLHLVTLLVVALGQYFYVRGHGAAFIYPDNGATSFTYHLFFASNWFTSELSFNGQIWSVSVEILIYMAFFLIVKQFGCGPIVALIVGLMSYVLLKLGLPWLNPSVFECGLFFFLGGAVQHYYTTRWALLIASVAAVSTTLLLSAGLIAMSTKLALVLALSAIVIFAKLRHGSLDRLVVLGNATYSSYLVHFPMQLGIVLFLDTAGIDREWMRNVPALLAYLALTIACSLLVYRWFEKPAQDYIRSWRVPGLRGS
jgi:peptidoglycan/LPS O-acetylase OafA/YrhL